MEKPLYYSDYLQLDKILTAQELESLKIGSQAVHDEMIFIIVHQTYELWFKQILIEIDSVLAIMHQPTLNDNSPELQTIVHRLNRVVSILKLLVQQIDVIETMTSMDFLDFRDYLYPASGFQSWQFKVLEAKLGLKYKHRHGQEYYISQLQQIHIDAIKEAEAECSLLELVNAWLERLPFFDVETYWNTYQSVSGNNSGHPFWADYEHIYANSLSAVGQKNSDPFKIVLTGSDETAERNLSAKACRSALFISLYHQYPMLELPFQLLNTLLEIDNQLTSWRSRHINMVRRTLGSRMGTGGSTGASYLQGARDNHHIFDELAQLNSFLINRQKLPILPEKLVKKLGYSF